MSGYKALDRSCKTDSYPCTSEYVTQVLTTLLNFAHGALTLRPLVYYSSCLPFLFVSLLPLLCCHVDTLLLLFKIFKCAILTCALCSLHGMTWIYYGYFIFLSVEKSMLAKPTNKQKNTVFSKRDHLESGYQFVCVCVFVSFAVTFSVCPVEFWWLWDNTAVLSWPSHDRLGWFISSKVKKNKTMNSCLFAWGWAGRGSDMSGCGQLWEDWPVNTHYIKGFKNDKGISASDHTCRYSHNNVITQ